MSDYLIQRKLVLNSVSRANEAATWEGRANQKLPSAPAWFISPSNILEIGPVCLDTWVFIGSVCTSIIHQADAFQNKLSCCFISAATRFPTRHRDTQPFLNGVTSFTQLFPNTINSTAFHKDSHVAAGRVFSSISATVPSLSALLFIQTCEFRLLLIPQNTGSGGGGGRVTVAPAVLNEPDRKHLLRTSGQTRDRTSTIRTAESPAGSSLLTGTPAAAAAGRNNTKRGLREFWTETAGEEVWRSSSLPDTPQLMPCSGGYSSSGLCIGLYHYLEGSAVVTYRLVSLTLPNYLLIITLKYVLCACSLNVT